jgi:hypothetical protein
LEFLKASIADLITLLFSSLHKSEGQPTCTTRKPDFQSHLSHLLTVLWRKEVIEDRKISFLFFFRVFVTTRTASIVT